ncbi:MAG TPA: phosphoglycerate kinase [Myxococcota bacterium]|nr:phosphoglycerate kinase [Myxococcota bacterium]
MSAPIRTLDQLELAGRTVLVRVDYNVPLDGDVVTDDTRVRMSLDTLRFLRERADKLVLMSHLGRPKDAPDPKYSLLPAAAKLAELLDVEVVFAHDTIGDEVKRLIEEQPTGAVVMLENLRFFPGEKNNDPEFARALADLGDVYVNDAFGTMHRPDASIVGVPKLMDAVAAGRLVQREIEALGGLLGAPRRPFGAVLGGAKVSDKIAVIDRLSTKVDHLFIGGAMAYTFLRAQGVDVGASRVEPEGVELALRVLVQAASRGCRVHLPIDHVVAPAFAADSPASVVEQIPEGVLGMDIGPQTVAAWGELLRGCRTLFWNGPLGVFEWPAFANGTRGVAELFAAADGFTVIGGGDSAAAAAQFGVQDRIDHISTGGGASLEYLRDGDLVGLDALRRKR